ncbi:MAG: transporter substrate-binding domain-containing protein [Methylocystaceae bacterium]|nr:transporter substrate-binding domain-containing protein [Methylocystaceae bacterium]
MGIFKYFLGLHILLIGSVCADLQAQERYLFVGTTFPSILETGADQKPKGVAVDLLEQISERTGDQFDIRILPWSRALELVKRGEASGLIGPYYSEERAEFLDFANDPFYIDRMVFISRRSDDVDWQGDYDFFKSSHILIIKNWFYGPDFEKARPHLKLYETITTEGALTMLMRERVDIVAFNERNAKHLIKALDMTTALKINEPPMAINRGFFGFSKKRKEFGLQNRMNKALRELQELGKIERINARYGLTYRAEW